MTLPGLARPPSSRVRENPITGELNRPGSPARARSARITSFLRVISEPEQGGNQKFFGIFFPTPGLALRRRSR